jgi:acyl carrier protein
MLNKIADILEEVLGADPQEVTEETHFMNDLGSDSLSLVDIIYMMEDEFDLRISDEEVESIATVGDAMDCIKAKMAQAA